MYNHYGKGIKEHLKLGRWASGCLEKNLENDDVENEDVENEDLQKEDLQNGDRRSEKQRSKTETHY